MKWVAGADELLLDLDQRGWPAELISERFGLPVVGVKARLLELKKSPPPPPPLPQEKPVLLTAEQVEEVKKRMNGIQSAFLDMASHYNSMGEEMKKMAMFVEMCLAPEEVADVIKKGLEASRLPKESIHAKLARVLSQHCIVIKKPGK